MLTLRGAVNRTLLRRGSRGLNEADVNKLLLSERERGALTPVHPATVQVAASGRNSSTDRHRSNAFHPPGVLSLVPQYCPNQAHLNGHGDMCLLWPFSVRRAFFQGKLDTIAFHDIAVRDLLFEKARHRCGPISLLPHALAVPFGPRLCPFFHQKHGHVGRSAAKRSRLASHEQHVLRQAELKRKQKMLKLRRQATGEDHLSFFPVRRARSRLFPVPRPPCMPPLPCTADSHILASIVVRSRPMHST